MTATMTAAPIRISTADTAKLVRKALAAAFPGVKFTVRSSVYSMGSSISVGWTDGPTAARVDAVCDRFQGCDFDSMQDLKVYREPVDGVRYGADWINTSRDYTAPMMERALAEAMHEGDEGTVAVNASGHAHVNTYDWDLQSRVHRIVSAQNGPIPGRNKAPPQGGGLIAEASEQPGCAGACTLPCTPNRSAEHRAPRPPSHPTEGRNMGQGTEGDGDQIDTERLAVLLDGRVRRRDRTALLGHLSTADSDYHAFADGAAILRELEPSRRTLRLRRRVRRRALHRMIRAASRGKRG